MAYEPTLDDVLNSLYGPEGGLTEEELAQYMPEPYVAPEYTPAPQGGGYAPVARGEAKLGGPRTPYDELIYQKAVAAGQDPNLIKAQIWAESSFNPKAVSHAGAQGLTQFMPGTWNKYGRGSPFDPNAAIDAQIAYNADLLQRFGGDERKVLAAYNWGEHRKSYALPDWERHAPAETRDYVQKILAKREQYAGAANRSYPIAAQDQIQSQESPFDIVKLSDGSAVEVEKGTDLAAVAEILKKSGVQAEPIKNVALPNGAFVEAPYSYSDAQVFDIVKKSKPEIFGEQPEDTKHGYGAAAKSSFEAGIGSALTGLGGLGAYAGEKLESPLARQAGEYLTGKGKEWQKMGEEAYQELTPEEAKALGFEGQFRKYVGEPVAGFVGSMGAALPALALPGGAATRIGAFAAQELGGQLAEQERMGQEADVEKALPYAVGSGIVQNSLLGPLKYVTKAFGKPDVLAKIAEITEKEGADAAKQYAGGMMKNILKETGINTAEVVTSEVISRAAERAASGQPLDTPDAIAEYEDIAIKSAPGGLLGIPGAFGVHAAKQGTIEEAQLAQAQEAQNTRIAEEQKAAEEVASVGVKEQAEADAELERQAGIGVPEPTIRGQENVAPTEPPLAVEEQPAPVGPVSASPPVAPEMGAVEIQAEPEADEIPEPTIRGKEPKLPEAVAPEVTNPADILGLNNRSGLRKQLQGFDINNVEDHPKIEGILQKTSAAFSAENLANLETKMKEVQSANGIQKPAAPNVGSFKQPEIRQEGQGAPVSSQGVRSSGQEIGAVKIPEVKIPEAETIAPIEQKVPSVSEAVNAVRRVEPLQSTKVVDEQGKPKAMYHGTGDVIEAFDKEGLGTHFTSDPEIASKFAESFDEGSNVHKVFLDIKNPLRVKDFGGSHSNATEVAKDFVKQGILPKNYVNDAFYDRIMEGVQGEASTDIYEKNNAKELSRIRKTLEDQGYDGLVYDNRVEGGGDTYVAFKPEQVVQSNEIPKAQEVETASVVKLQTPAEAWESLRTPDQPAFESLSKNTQDLWKKEYKENEGIVSKDAVADYVKAEGIQSAKNIEIKEPTLYTWGKGAGHLFDEEALQRRNLARGAKPVETKGSMAPEYEAAFGKHLYESAKKYFAPGGGYEKGERYRVTAGKGGYRLFKTLDAAKDFAEQFGMKKGTRRVLDEYVPTKEELTTEQAAYVEPDKEKRLKLDAARYSDIKQGKELLQRYIEQGKDEKLKTLASLLAESPHAEAVKVSFVKQGDTLPNNVINGLRGANAIAVTGENGSHLYYRADSPDAFGEDILVHEAVHGLTTAAIRRSPHLNKALEDMSVNVGIGLSDAAARNPTPELKNIEEFWRGAVRRKPGEMLAYGLTSPTFKKILENYTADGKPIDLVKQDYARASISRQIPQPKTPKPLTLWQKFVDTIRRLFRIPEKNKEAFEQAVAEYHENVAAREEAIQKQITPKSLAAQLDEYLNQLLEVTKKEGIAMPTKETEISAAKKESTPLVKETEAESSLKRGMKEAVGAFKGNAWTRMETNYVNRHAALADAIKDKSTIDSNGKYRADLIGSANDQIFNVISAGITDGVPVYSSAGTVMIQKDTKKNLSNIAKRIDKLNVKNSRVYVGEIARALRGESLKKEDAEALKTIDTLEEKAKKLKAHAKTQSFAEGKKADTLANRYLAEANKLKKRVGEEGREKLVTDEDILEAKRRLAEHPEIQNILDDIHGLMNSLVDLWEASGLVSKDVAKDWRSKPSYIPLYMSQEDILSDPSRVVRMMGGGAKSLPNVKALKGGTHAINLLENLQKHYAFMTSAAAQNSYRKAAARDLELFGAAERTSPDDKNTIMFKDNGKEVYYKIADPLMFEAFQAAAPLTNPLLKAAREYTKAFRAVTLVNPLYWYRQLIRDPIHANVVSKTGMVTPIGATISFAKIIAGASPEYAELRRRGVVGAVDALSDPARFKKIYDKGPNLFKKGADWVMHVHEAADAATRVEVYKAAAKEAKKRGMSKEQAKDYATMRAREIINFANQGRSETLQAIRATVPFFSAALNSLDSVARAAAGKGLNRREAAEARRLFTSRMLMIASFTTAYALAMQDDEDYLKSPDSINNWLWPTGNKNEPFKLISLPFELGFFAKVLPEYIVRLNSGTLTPYEGKKMLKEAASATLTPPLPLPQVLKPLVEIALNHDLHTGRSIVSPSEAGKLPEEQTKGASALSIEIGRKLGLSPAMVEHFLRGYLSELFTVVSIAAEQFLPAGQKREERYPGEIPILAGGSKGISSVPGRDRDMDIFYELANGAQQIKRSMSAAQGKGDVEAMERIMADPEKKKRFYASDVGRNIGDEISEVNKAIEQIRNDESITDPKKKQEMIRGKQQYKNRLATQGKEWFYSLGVNEP